MTLVEQSVCKVTVLVNDVVKEGPELGPDHLAVATEGSGCWPVQVSHTWRNPVSNGIPFSLDIFLRSERTSENVRQQNIIIQYSRPSLSLHALPPHNSFPLICNRVLLCMTMRELRWPQAISAGSQTVPKMVQPWRIFYLLVVLSVVVVFICS